MTKSLRQSGAMSRAQVNDKLEEQVALVSGASRGIGRAIAISLAAQGARVVCVGRDTDALQHTVNACQAVGGEAMACAADLRSLEDVEAMHEAVHEAFGPIHVLINNAGMSARGAIHELDPATLEGAVEVNLTMHMRLTARLAPEIMKARGGAILFIASIAGKSGFGGSSAYCAAKHGVMGFAQSVFEDLRERGVKVCAIAPGYVNTDMVSGLDHVDPARMIQPEDVAETVLFVLGCAPTVCPTEIVLRPQRSPYRS